MNVLIQPVSGSIYFDNNSPGSNTTAPGNVTLSYNTSGALTVSSNASASTLRFAVSGGQGGLFSVYDSLTGQIFAVNKIGGIPIVEVYDNDTVKLGTYLSNTLLVSGTQVSVGGLPLSATVPNKLSIIGNTATTGSLNVGTIINDISGNSNQWNNAYTLLNTATATTFKVTNLSASSTITSPVIDTTASSANLYATPSTVTAFGAAATINLGYTNNTGSSNTFNIATQAQAFGSTKTVNIGTGGTSNSTTNVNLGSTSGTSTVTASGNLIVTNNINTGTNTYTKTAATGDISLDNGSTDTPGVLYYYGNNNNWGIDSWNGSFGVLSGQLWRITNNLNESGGAMKMAIDTTGNIYATGFIQAGAYRAGQVIKDTMLDNTQFTVNATTVATSTTDTDFITYSYTPVSSSSYLIIHVHVGRYSAKADTGGAGTDSYFSRIKVDGSEIVYAWQYTRSTDSSRTGSLFPLTGRYTNSNTTAKTITVGVRRDTADDDITIVNSATALWMRITEIAR